MKGFQRRGPFVKSRMGNQPGVGGTLYIVGVPGFVLIWTSFQAYAKYLPQEQTPKSRSWIIFQPGRPMGWMTRLTGVRIGGGNVGFWYFTLVLFRV